MFNISAYFADPRYRRERIILVIIVPLVLIVVGGGGYYLVQRQKKETKEDVARVLPDLPPTEKPVMPTPPPETPAQRLDRAAAAYKRGNTEEAARILAEVDLDEVNSPVGWALAGLLQAEAGNNDGAIDFYTQGINKTPSAELYYRRALLYRQARNMKEAYADFLKASDLSPTDIVLTNERILTLIQLGRKEEARDLATALVQTDGTARSWIFGLAGLALEQQQYPEAAELLERARTLVDERTYRTLLDSPALSNYQNRPEIMEFFLQNIN